MSFTCERELVDRFCSLALGMGYRVYVEVPCFSQNIDIVVDGPRGRVAIECKMNDWRRGLSQARRHLLAFDYSYVCMPERRITDIARDEFMRTGVGLVFLCDNALMPVRQAIPAQKSREKVVGVEESLVRLIEEECHAYGE